MSCPAAISHSQQMIRIQNVCMYSSNCLHFILCPLSGMQPNRTLFYTLYDKTVISSNGTGRQQHAIELIFFRHTLHKNYIKLVYLNILFFFLVHDGYVPIGTTLWLQQGIRFCSFISSFFKALLLIRQNWVHTKPEKVFVKLREKPCRLFSQKDHHHRCCNSMKQSLYFN